MAGKWIRGRAAVFALIMVMAAGTAAMAGAVQPAKTVLGNLVLEFGLESSPNTLPADKNVPISFGGSMGIETKDGSVPPKLERLDFEIDKYGKVETRGLPICPQSKLLATTTPQARRQCPDAIVGRGSGRGIIAFPEQPPIHVQAPLTFFNGPKIGGDPTVIVHAHLTVPTPATYLTPLRIEHINNGVYGFRVGSEIPEIAGGSGTVTGFTFEIDRKWEFRGKRMHYLYARCPSGLLQAILKARFDDGTRLQTHYVHPCKTR